MALRGLKGIKVRWDIAPEGATDGSLPNLHLPSTESLKGEISEKSESQEDGIIIAACSIPTWVDRKLGINSTTDPLEGFKDQEAKVESRAWVTLLEDVVHAALVRIF